MNQRELLTTFFLALTTAGGAFFATNVEAGYQPAFWAAGGAFFSSFGSLMVAMGLDPRRRAEKAAEAEAEAQPVLLEAGTSWELSDHDIDRLANAIVAKRAIGG